MEGSGGGGGAGAAVGTDGGGGGGGGPPAETMSYIKLYSDIYIKIFSPKFFITLKRELSQKFQNFKVCLKPNLTSCLLSNIIRLRSSFQHIFLTLYIIFGS